MLPIHNQIQLIGRAGHDVELLTLTDGTYRATLRLYQNERVPGREHEAQVHSLVAWSAVATQLHARIRRGDRILVQGKLLHRKFEVNGQPTVKSEIHVAHFSLLGSRSITRSVSLAAEPAPETFG
ncbi:single-strand DNA-binding protein [Lewinella aquimaris]|uniref:Single-strand DNA-binding protein n=1 Tax=Neolewinella aquimaris TaxID=1835722 RepID=A0A840E7W9_9BACT|nr:single-stranded DNA-binding protein [Neolewinella aquimaris]MBB4077889.1 single-strand DNA-binding protein [Neolewinella aquimaris]